MGEVNNPNQNIQNQTGGAPGSFRPQEEQGFPKVVSARPIENANIKTRPAGKGMPPGLQPKKSNFLEKLKNKLLFKKSKEEREREAKEVEFIPEELIRPSKLIKELRMPIFLISLVVVFLLLIYSSMTAYKLRLTNTLKQIDEEIQTAEFQLANYKKIVKEIETFKKSMKLVKQKLDTHIYWNKFFELFEKHTLKTVTFSGFAGDTTGNFVLPAQTDSYESLAKQLIAFQEAEDLIESVDITSGSKETLEEEGKSYIIFNTTLQVKPEVFIIGELPDTTK